MDRDLDTCNKIRHTQGSVVQSDLKLGLLTGSRAKTDAWLFSAMLFPFCLAGSQEEQGLECEPFGGGLRPPLLGCFAGAGLAGAAFPREGAEDRPGASVAGLYLEQSISWEGKGNAAVGDRLGHFSSISIWHRRAQGQRSWGHGGAFPTRTQTQLTERKVLCPNRYQHLRGSVGDIPGARHWGSLSCPGTWPDSSSHQLGRGHWSH